MHPSSEFFPWLEYNTTGKPCMWASLQSHVCGLHSKAMYVGLASNSKLCIGLASKPCRSAVVLVLVTMCLREYNIHRLNMVECGSVRLFFSVGVGVRMCVCVRACVCWCMCACVCVQVICRVSIWAGTESWYKRHIFETCYSAEWRSGSVLGP